MTHCFLMAKEEFTPGLSFIKMAILMFISGFHLRRKVHILYVKGEMDTKLYLDKRIYTQKK